MSNEHRQFFPRFQITDACYFGAEDADDPTATIHFTYGNGREAFCSAFVEWRLDRIEDDVPASRLCPNCTNLLRRQTPFDVARNAWLKMSG